MLNLSYDKILFLDIETVPQYATFAELNPAMQHLWEEKFAQLSQRQPDRYEGMTAADGFADGGGIYAEYGRIVCISVGFCYVQDGERCFRTKSFAGDDECAILRSFFDLVERFMTTQVHTFCGHNVKEFDIPYICRRALVNGLKLPKQIQIAGKKPWELNFIDTMELWKFGDFKSFTSLKVLTAIFGIPTPKDDIDGSEVARVYYEEHNIQRIATYCQKDVLATAQVLLRLCGDQVIADECITHVACE